MNEENQNKINSLFEELVPNSGKAETLAGEIVRAVSRIGYRYYNDGDQIGIGYGKETCNAAARFLMNRIGSEIENIITKLWGLYCQQQYELLLDDLIDAVVRYIERNPGLRQTETIDMFSYFNPDEDRDFDEDEYDEY